MKPCYYEYGITGGQALIGLMNTFITVMLGISPNGPGIGDVATPKAQ